uniref:Uncharacterized protein n=1 Tax=Arundo donax TaxID=35708 RepID=A0A0A9BEH1_ARUDO
MTGHIPPVTRASRTDPPQTHAAPVFAPFFLQHNDQIHPQQVLWKLPLIGARACTTYARPGDLPDSPAPLEECIIVSIREPEE